MSAVVCRWSRGSWGAGRRPGGSMQEVGGDGLRCLVGVSTDDGISGGEITLEETPPLRAGDHADGGEDEPAPDAAVLEQLGQRRVVDVLDVRGAYAEHGHDEEQEDAVDVRRDEAFQTKYGRNFELLLLDDARSRALSSSGASSSSAPSAPSALTGTRPERCAPLRS